jgi:phosphoserine phosphatase RsbU/P
MVPLLQVTHLQSAQISIFRSILLLELANIAVASALLTFAFAAVALFLFRRRTRELTLLYFAVFCLLYALRMLASCSLVRSLFHQPGTFWVYVNWFITCTILVPFSLFFHQVMPENLKKFVRWMIYAQSAFAIFGIVAAASGKHLSALGLANNIVVLATVVSGTLLFFVGSRDPASRSSREVRVFVGGFLVWALFIIHINLIDLRILRGINLEFIGFFIFVCCLAYISLNRIFANEQRLLAINKELEIARSIQSSILPRSVPTCRGLEIAARYVPMSAVAGDFYDFLPVDENHLGILVADVTGHGVPAALIASMLKVAFAGQTAHAHDPARVLTGLNLALCGKFEEHFVTAAYLFVDLEKGLLRYAAAAHPPVLLSSNESRTAAEVEENGLMLGVFPEAAYSFIELPIASGTRCLLYTDGLFESSNMRQEEFGKSRCKQFLQDHSGLSAANFADRLLHSIATFSGHASGRAQEDDITILVLDFQ